MERRNLSTLPPPPGSVKEFIAYPDAINLYYSDHFGLRERLTKTYFKFITKLRGRSSSDDVTFGKEGWMFLGSIKPGYKRFDDPMGDAINANLFSEQELENFAKSITTTKNWLKNKGIAYIYVIAPNKHSIYFDKFPEYISKQNRKSSTDQLSQYLQEHTDVIVADLRPALLEEKKTHQVYYKSNTHWNHYGANAAQFEIMKKIKPLFPGQISPWRLDDGQFEVQSIRGGDLAGLAKIDNIKEESPQPLFKGRCNPTNEPSRTKDTETHTMVCETQTLNAVIFRDSFFTALHPYISRYFHRSTYISERLNYDSLKKYVEQEKPDIIIDEVVERTLPYQHAGIPSGLHF
ncbi:MAG: hypothetical protein ACE5FZ_01540 [Nitrospiria bacterium]